jgi:hypothetical protein
MDAVSKSAAELRSFLEEHGPLDIEPGRRIFY